MLATARDLSPSSAGRPSFWSKIAVAAFACMLIPTGAAHAADASAINPEVGKLLPANLNGVLHGALPSALQAKGIIVMATDASAGKPIAWVEADSSIKGLTVDVAEALGYVLGVKAQVANTPFDDMIPSLQAGRSDYSVSDMLDTKKREKVVDFVDYLIDGSSILVSADSSLHDLTLDKMCGLTAGTTPGTVEEGYLDKQAAQCKAEGRSALTVNIYQGNNALLLALVSKRIDLLMGPSSQLAYIQQVFHGKAKQGGAPIGVAVDGIAVLKGTGLAAPLQQALQKLIDNGVYQKMLGLYGMQSNGLPKATLDNASF